MQPRMVWVVEEEPRVQAGLQGLGTSVSSHTVCPILNCIELHKEDPGRLHC